MTASGTDSNPHENRLEPPWRSERPWCGVLQANRRQPVHWTGHRLARRSRSREVIDHMVVNRVNARRTPNICLLELGRFRESGRPCACGLSPRTRGLLPGCIAIFADVCCLSSLPQRGQVAAGSRRGQGCNGRGWRRPTPGTWWRACSVAGSASAGRPSSENVTPLAYYVESSTNVSTSRSR